ncbi:MAG TPA: CPBP family intramembrane metalloprotease [Spirochaetota bacterium]|nr:CPBP family intramembrane metalloprotease [Spirochaetota bacterium]
MMRIPLLFALVVWTLALLGILGLSQWLPPRWSMPAAQLLLLSGALLGARFLLPGRGELRNRLALRPQPAGEVVLAGATAILLLPGLQMLFDRLLRQFSGYADYVSGQQAVLGGDSLGLGYGFLAVAIVLLPPICEELFFRGYLSSALRSSGYTRAAIILTGGLLFGLFHLDPWRLVPVSILGMIMVWLVETGGSILAGMAFPMVNNGIIFFGAVLAASTPNAGLDNADLSLGQVFFAAGLFLLGVLTLATFARRAALRRSKEPNPFSQAAGRPGNGL